MDRDVVSDRAHLEAGSVAPRLDPQEFADLALTLRAAHTVEQTADQVVEHALTALGADHGGIVLLLGGRRPQTVAPSSDLVVALDRAQFELQDGPSYDDGWRDRTVASQSLEQDPRWPAWACVAGRHGIAALLAAQLTGSDNGHLGALNLYWDTEVTFTTDDLAYVSIFATHAAVALAASVQQVQLNTALDTRKVIGQAQGILMERHRLSTEQAFEVLRRYSQDHNLKLRDVARELVDTRRLPGRGDGRR